MKGILVCSMASLFLLGLAASQDKKDKTCSAKVECPNSLGAIPVDMPATAQFKCTDKSGSCLATLQMKVVDCDLNVVVTTTRSMGFTCPGSVKFEPERPTITVSIVPTRNLCALFCARLTCTTAERPGGTGQITCQDEDMCCANIKALGQFD